MRLWLHEATGDESGWTAWSLDLLGFATWAPTEVEVLQRVPAKIAEYRSWRAHHGISAPDVGRQLQVVEYGRGDEIVFAPDKEPAEVAEIDLALRLLEASRRDLLATVSALSAKALDWDPPYRAFATWATWRTVRAIVAHIANTETHYYLPSVGYEPRVDPAPADGDWREFLPRHRRETVAFLMAVRGADDRVRLSQQEEAWSLRKVLRRLVRHELLHWKSIRRITRAYTQQRPDAARDQG